MEQCLPLSTRNWAGLVGAAGELVAQPLSPTQALDPAEHQWGCLVKKPTKSSLWKARVIVSSVLSKYCLMFCHMRGVGCIPHERFHVSAAISPRRMATALKSSRMHHLVVCYNGATRLPLLFPFEKTFPTGMEVVFFR